MLLGKNVTILAYCLLERLAQNKCILKNQEAKTEAICESRIIQ